MWMPWWSSSAKRWPTFVTRRPTGHANALRKHTQHTCGTIVGGMLAHLLETPSLLALLLLLPPLRTPPPPSKQRAFAQETTGLFEGPVARHSKPTRMREKNVPKD